MEEEIKIRKKVGRIDGYKNEIKDLKKQIEEKKKS